MRYSLIRIPKATRTASKFAGAGLLLLAFSFAARGCIGTDSDPIQNVSSADIAVVSGTQTMPPVRAVSDAPDIGGELITSDADYDGELDVPAYIRLERIELTDDKLQLPLKSAHVSSLFGYRRNPVTGKYTFHSGYDLAAPAGSEIYAMLSGTVNTAGWDNGYGNYIILDHGDGLQTLYAHCSKLLVSRGEKVAAGQTVAIIGSTGNSTGTHLHVEFRKDGQRYDPEWILGGIYD